MQTKGNSRLSERKIVVLLLFLLGRSSDPPRWLRVVQQVQNIVHKVVLVRVLLVVEPRLERLLKDGHNVGAVRCGHKLKWTVNFFYKLVASVGRLLLQIHFVGDHDAGDVWTLVAHLRIPIPQVRVSHLARHVEHHNTDVSAEVICRVQLIE